MHRGEQAPRIEETASISSALLEMTQKKLGMTAVVNNNQQLVGVFTDGDLRRMLMKSIDIHTTLIGSVMTNQPIVISADMLAAEAMRIMEQKKINALCVVDDNYQLVGALSMHDLIHAGLV